VPRAPALGHGVSTARQAVVNGFLGVAAEGSTNLPDGWTINGLPIVRRLVMCYSWHEDVEKTAQNDIAQEDPRKSVPEGPLENRVQPEHSRFWTLRIGRRDPATEEATVDRIREMV
jgi:hypothetical protein